MQREDLVVKFGALRHPQPNLQALAAVVAENENVRPCFSPWRLWCYLDGVYDAYTEGDQCPCAAVWDRWPHCPEAGTEAGLGRARFLGVCFIHDSRC